MMHILYINTYIWRYLEINRKTKQWKRQENSTPPKIRIV